MAKFELAAFADEYSPVFDEQIKGLVENGITNLEIRGVDGHSIDAVTPDEAKELKKKLDASGIRVSSMGSPLGKIDLKDDMDAHIEKEKHIIELAHIFGCDRIRMFSFYHEGRDADDCRSEVMDRLGQMLKASEGEGVVLCHENERGIYGDNAVRCLDIQKEFGGEIKLVFDHANFICVDCEPYPYAFDMLKDYIFYMHIKDAMPDKTMAPAGVGCGRFVETFTELDKYDKTYICTVEPHLQVFEGLAELEGKDSKVVTNQYPSRAAAFKAACDAIKGVIAKAQCR